MKKKRSRELIEQAVDALQVANVYMNYNENYYNLIPIQTGPKLFLAINEADFLFDGFRISRFRDIEAVRIKDDKCDEILRSEGLFDDLQLPALDLESWQTAFEGLQKIGNNIIVQYETPDGEDDELAIGKILRIYKSCLHLYHFDADGIWAPKPYRIPYSEVTSVIFGSRYVNVFSKYIAPPPADKRELTIQLQTERCTIREFRREDVAGFAEYRNNMDWMRYQGYKGKSIRVYERDLLHTKALEQGRQLAVVHTETGKLLGDLYLRRAGDEYWIGYAVHPAHARQGYAREAVAEIMRWIADRGGRAIKAGVLPENTASIRLLEALRFTRTGEEEGELLYTYPLPCAPGGK